MTWSYCASSAMARSTGSTGSTNAFQGPQGFNDRRIAASTAYADGSAEPDIREFVQVPKPHLKPRMLPFLFSRIRHFPDDADIVFMLVSAGMTGKVNLVQLLQIVHRTTLPGHSTEYHKACVGGTLQPSLAKVPKRSIRHGEDVLPVPRQPGAVRSGDAAEGQAFVDAQDFAVANGEMGGDQDATVNVEADQAGVEGGV
jgi:hypothetical protein